jgi:hypothetical protein
MIVIAWILAIIGAIMAFIISLAGAMKTVPQLHWQEALVGIPLPLIAGIIAAWCLFREGNPPRPASQRPWISAGIPLVVAFLTLLLMAVSYFEQPGGLM